MLRSESAPNPICLLLYVCGLYIHRINIRTVNFDCDIHHSLLLAFHPTYLVFSTVLESPCTILWKQWGFRAPEYRHHLHAIGSHDVPTIMVGALRTESGVICFSLADIMYH